MTEDRMVEIQGMYDLLLDTGVAQDVSIRRYLADVGELLAHVIRLEAERRASERVITAAYEVDISLRAAGFQSGEADELHNALALHAAALSEQEEPETRLICDGCNQEAGLPLGANHEILHDKFDRFPELCGKMIEVPTGTPAEPIIIEGMEE